VKLGIPAFERKIRAGPPSARMGCGDGDKVHIAFGAKVTPNSWRPGLLYWRSRTTAVLGFARLPWCENSAEATVQGPPQQIDAADGRVF